MRRSMAFVAGFICGASAALALVGWILSEEDFIDLSFENEEGHYGFRGRMTEWPNA